MSVAYPEFLNAKSQLAERDGFEPVFMPDFLFGFQRVLVEWALLHGRPAVLADCGLGKTPMELVFAENVARAKNGRTLILTPLAVAAQTVLEGEKFGIECHRSYGGTPKSHITVASYGQLHNFEPADFDAIVLDESSVLKQFKGQRRKQITEFMRRSRYRLLCSATAAPNDYVEFGNSSEALGHMGHMDMLGTFFRNDEDSLHPTGFGAKWVFKAHAEDRFWKWLVSWARAIRRPSDLGFDDGDFKLPPLEVIETLVKASRELPGSLFAMPAITEAERREERRATITERCEEVARLVSHDQPAVAWCHLNEEGDLLERLIPGAIQVSGSDSDESKEERLLGFARGEFRVLITKPSMAAFGLNWQHCAHQTFFPSHSFEQYYQAVRRCWRFGQKRAVTVDIVASEGEAGVLANLRRKERQADAMFARLVATMNDAIAHDSRGTFPNQVQVPAWL